MTGCANLQSGAQHFESYKVKRALRAELDSVQEIISTASANGALVSIQLPDRKIIVIGTGDSGLQIALENLEPLGAQDQSSYCAYVPNKRSVEVVTGRQCASLRTDAETLQSLVRYSTDNQQRIADVSTDLDQVAEALDRTMELALTLDNSFRSGAILTEDVVKQLVSQLSAVQNRINQSIPSYR